MIRAALGTAESLLVACAVVLPAAIAEEVAAYFYEVASDR